MKIKRIVAPDIRQAIQLVRETLGPDAVILSNRNVDGGVEILAALDFDAQLVTTDPEAPASETPRPPANPNPVGRAHPTPNHFSIEAAELASKFMPDPKKRVPPPTAMDDEFGPGKTTGADQILLELRRELRGMRELLDERLADGLPRSGSAARPDTSLAGKLAGLGFSTTLATSIARQFGGTGNALPRALEAIADQLPLHRNNPIDHGGIVALVGPTGVGKTTTLAKLAAHHVLRHGSNSLGLITIDNYRVAAHEQLKTYGRLLYAPVRTVADPEELGRALDDFSSKRLVLIDTAGMSQRDAKLTEQLTMLREGGMPIDLYLTVSAATQAHALAQTFKAFSAHGLKACVLTKLDEATSYGAGISALIEHRLPLAYLCDGQRVPEDLHLAQRDRIAALCGYDSATPAPVGADMFSDEYRMAQIYA